VIRSGLVDRLQRRFEIRARSQRKVVKIIQRSKLVNEIERTVDINCSTGVRSLSSIINWIFAVRRLTSAVCKSVSY